MNLFTLPGMYRNATKWRFHEMSFNTSLEPLLRFLIPLRFPPVFDTKFSEFHFHLSQDAAVVSVIVCPTKLLTKGSWRRPVRLTKSVLPLLVSLLNFARPRGVLCWIHLPGNLRLPMLPCARQRGAHLSRRIINVFTLHFRDFKSLLGLSPICVSVQRTAMHSVT